MNPKIINYIRSFFLLGVLIMNNFSCKKEETSVTNLIPKVTTNSISLILRTAATGGGDVNASAGKVIAKGVCWSTNSNPTISDNKTTDGNGTDLFTSSITGLTANTLYYVRAYATTSSGTGYGDTISFKTLPPINYGAPVTDIDGNVYKTVIIGTQTWMIENLKTTHYNNGDTIPYTDTCNLGSKTSPKYQFTYGHFAESESLVATYGRYYTWYAVTDNRGVCPSGYHVPSTSEWTDLVSYLGGNNVAGGKMKAESGWCKDHTVASNDNWSGFTALAAGVISDGCGFDAMGCGGYFWSSTDDGSGNNTILGLWLNDAKVYFLSEPKYIGYSVRCIKN